MLNVGMELVAYRGRDIPSAVIAGKRVVLFCWVFFQCGCNQLYIISQYNRVESVLKYRYSISTYSTNSSDNDDCIKSVYSCGFGGLGASMTVCLSVHKGVLLRL